MARQSVKRQRPYIRSADHVPVHMAPRHVPEPDVPLSRPKPTARLMPVLKLTLMLPASATRPDAETAALLEAIWPLLMPIATVAPLPQVSLDEAMRTFQAPSNVLALARAAGNAMVTNATKRHLRKLFMTRPFVEPAGILSCAWDRRCDHRHARQTLCDVAHFAKGTAGKSKGTRITGPLSLSERRSRTSSRASRSGRRRTCRRKRSPARA